MYTPGQLPFKREPMDCRNLSFSGHAIQRMFERKISPGEVRQAVRLGEVVAEYPDDAPFPSCLLLFEGGMKPLHVVVGVDAASGRCHIITVYSPDPELWEADFRTRKTR